MHWSNRVQNANPSICFAPSMPGPLAGSHHAMRFEQLQVDLTTVPESAWSQPLLCGRRYNAGALPRVAPQKVRTTYPGNEFRCVGGIRRMDTNQLSLHRLSLHTTLLRIALPMECHRRAECLANWVYYWPSRAQHFTPRTSLFGPHTP